MSPIECEIHDKFTLFGANAKEWLRKCALLLPEIARLEIWRKKGFGSIHEYAAKIGGMSRSSVDEALRVMKKIEDKPALQKVVGELGIQRVRPVAAIATPETAAFWAEKARTMSKNALETYVQEFHREFPREEVIHNNSESESKRAQVLFNFDIESKLAAEILKLKGKREWEALFKELLAAREMLIMLAKPDAVRTKRRHIPEKIQQHVIAKTNGQCAFPNCAKPFAILHHTQRFALENVHDPQRIVPLCKNHERIAHYGLIQNEQETPMKWKIQKAPDLESLEYAIDQRVMAYRNYSP